MRLPVWEESWDVLGLRAWQKNDRRQECYLWGLSFPLQQSTIQSWLSWGAAKGYILGRVWGGWG